MSSFNPRPPLLAGDAHGWRVVLNRQLVSIRARHCWRAMRRLAGAGIEGMKRFNPRPPLLAGDACCVDGGIKLILGFNPRPPLLAGDASPPGAREWGWVVSTRARHCWRALLRLSHGKR